MKRIDKLEDTINNAVCCALGGAAFACNLQIPNFAFPMAIVASIISVVGDIQTSHARQTPSQNKYSESK